jgi:hypothetical protein
VTGCGRRGNAIARDDRAVVVTTGRTVIVTAVDHQTGRILARPQHGGQAVEYAGIDPEDRTRHDHKPDDARDAVLRAGRDGAGQWAQDALANVSVRTSRDSTS